MSLAYVSPDLSSKARNYIESNIFLYNGYLTSNQEDADLIICNNLSMIKQNTISIPRISFVCFKSMVEQDIDPFDYKYESKILVNIFFKDKTFMFYQASPQTIQQCTRVIEIMNGTIKKEDADYCLTENEDGDCSRELISVEWIFALQHSTSYIPPDSFIISKKPQRSQRIKKNCSQKSSFPGKLQIYCSDKPESPIFPRITSQRSQTSSTKLAGRGELSIFTSDSIVKTSPRINASHLTQPYLSPSITTKNRKNDNLNHPRVKRVNTERLYSTQVFKLGSILNENDSNPIKNSEKIEYNELDSCTNNLIGSRNQMEIDFIDQLTSFSQVIKSDDEDDDPYCIRYEPNDRTTDETDSDATCSQDPILLALSS